MPCLRQLDKFTCRIYVNDTKLYAFSGLDISTMLLREPVIYCHRFVLSFSSREVALFWSPSVALEWTHSHKAGLNIKLTFAWVMENIQSTAINYTLSGQQGRRKVDWVPVSETTIYNISSLKANKYNRPKSNLAPFASVKVMYARTELPVHSGYYIYCPV